MLWPSSRRRTVRASRVQQTKNEGTQTHLWFHAGPEPDYLTQYDGMTTAEKDQAFGVVPPSEPMDDGFEMLDRPPEGSVFAPAATGAPMPPPPPSGSGGAPPPPTDKGSVESPGFAEANGSGKKIWYQPGKPGQQPVKAYEESYHGKDFASGKTK